MAGLDQLGQYTGAFGTGTPQEDATRPPTIPDHVVSSLGAAVARALMAPGQAYNSTEPITTDQMIAPAHDIASLMMGGGTGGIEGAGVALGSGPMRMIENADLLKELANQRRAQGMAVGKSAPGWDFKRPDAAKGSWDDLVARTKAGWEGDKARALDGYHDATGTGPTSPLMTADDYAAMADPKFVLGSGATDPKMAALLALAQALKPPQEGK